MRYCPHCSSELNGSTRRCSSCGLSIDVETVALPVDSQAYTPTLRAETPNRNKTPWATGDGGRFVAGTVLAGRYRIVGLLGKGGMGEVYKADDLELDQAVALKFLTEQLSQNEELLRRFRSEVRLARQVSHRNVCRVFDIGETEGLYYITMEYMDGDNLSTLLKRIGRLPADKAVEISREICMGLAAIHRAGILHRDLKPANIIIDSKGEARITDFGIAGIESEVQGAEARVGTPAYMSPEQIDGKEITTRSDIYSLGLVLYEIFTGKPAFEGGSAEELQIKHATTNPRKPSEIVTGIDSIVENVINRCLEKNPNDRPESALKVAMSLPGGDPLQAALNAGETPSPEMVAAAPKVGSLRPAVGACLLATVFLAFGFNSWTSKYSDLWRFVPLDKSLDVLQDRGRELVERYGYSQKDSYSYFVQLNDYIIHIQKNDQSPQRWSRLLTGQPAVLQFSYRTSPKPLAPLSRETVTKDDPPLNVPGMTELRLDTKGRLVSFAGVPPRVEELKPVVQEFDWSTVFRDAGFDFRAFAEVDPQWTPSTPFDELRALRGSYPDAPDVPILVQAAAYHGKLVSFEIVEPWTLPPGQTDPRDDGAATAITIAIVFAIYFGILVASGWLAIKNVRRKRSDVNGALRVFVFLFVIRFLNWFSTTHHVRGLDEVNLLITGLASALYWAAFAGLMYLSLEPYMRKNAPERMVSWNRLLAGEWRDPLVGRDVLIGAATAAVLCFAVQFLILLLPLWLGQPSRAPGMITAYLSGLGGFPERLLSELSSAFTLTFVFSFLILFFGLLLRRKWLGTFVVSMICIAFAVVLGIANEQTYLEIVGLVILAVCYVLIPARFGFVAFLSFLLFLGPFDGGVPIGTWYSAGFVAYAVLATAVAIYGFYTSTSGQKLWNGSLLGDEV